MRRNRWFVQDEEGGGEGGAGGGGGDNGAVEPAVARAFVADFVDDPKSIESWDDKKVVDFHGRLTGAIDKVRPAGSGKWPEKWRDEFAGGDEKALKQLERYGSPADVWKKARALEQRVTSGELKANVAFPEKGTDAEKAAWRAEQGIPATHDKYDLKLPEGMVLGEADKALVDDFLTSAHAGNMPPAAVSEATKWFFANKEKQMAAAKEATAKVQKDTEDELRGEWGNDYRKHESLIDGFLTETLADEDLRNDLAEARKVNPKFAKWMLGMALQLNPTGTVLPGEGQNQVQAVTDEIAGLQKMMGNRDSEYWKGPKAQANQARYRELVAWKDKQKKAA